MNFIGHYYHALEQKGRIAIPSVFRRELGKKIIITRGLEECLFVFPESIWLQTVGEVPIHPFGKKIDREWIRLVTHNAQESNFDSQGRILIQDHLINFAKLEKNCVIAGSVNYLEIWDRDIYHAYMELLDLNAKEITERKYE
jgi:MraZ protein